MLLFLLLPSLALPPTLLLLPLLLLLQLLLLLNDTVAALTHQIMAAKNCFRNRIATQPVAVR
jgi:hypothetical protein